MHQLQDSVYVHAAPEHVWSWLAGLTHHYAQWHPDHVSAAWVSGEANQVGSVLEAVEYVGGRREKLRFVMTEVAPPTLMEYRIAGAHGLLLAGGAFLIVADGDGSTFTASIRYRFGWVVERLFTRRAQALRAHMREEGENLKRLVEAEN